MMKTQPTMQLLKVRMVIITITVVTTTAMDTAMVRTITVIHMAMSTAINRMSKSNSTMTYL
jgi:uncharacterized membrane protein YgaE (UPF0421/DUF939 family)